MRTRPPVPHAANIVGVKCALMLTALSLAAMTEPVAAQAPAKPPAAKAAAPAKTYPPFDAKASASALGVMVYPKNGQPIEQ